LVEHARIQTLVLERDALPRKSAYVGGARAHSLLP
jgi:hypothetical protein